MYKKIDSAIKLEEYFQDKNGEKWKIIDIEAREGFSNSIESKIKCEASINVHGDGIKLIDKRNRNAARPLYNEV